MDIEYVKRHVELCLDSMESNMAKIAFEQYTAEGKVLAVYNFVAARKELMDTINAITEVR